MFFKNKRRYFYCIYQVFTDDKTQAIGDIGIYTSNNRYLSKTIMINLIIDNWREKGYNIKTVQPINIIEMKKKDFLDFFNLVDTSKKSNDIPLNTTIPEDLKLN